MLLRGAKLQAGRNWGFLGLFFGFDKFGDAGAWGQRVKTGYASLLNSALHGKGAMGAQGGGDFDDFEVARAVVYMANAGGGKFDEPKKAEAAK